MGLLDYLRSLLTGESVPRRPEEPTPRAAREFTPAHPVTVRYRNFAEQEKTFVAEKDSIVRQRNHLVARFAPSGRKMVLSRDRIQNLGEVESVVPERVASGQSWPTPRERQVLGYHKKHGTTSPLFEKIRAKYPNW